jgi:cyclophilin family peptidyl-prolyl cis-trans isomerase
MATECPAPDGSSPRTTTFASEMPMCIDTEKQYQATIVTNHGTMTAFLYPNKAPKTVNNFVCLARYHYFDGLTFHRIIQDFVIQGGCPEGTGRGGPGYRFEDELPERGKYEVGSLAMANAGPNTNGSQFFVISGGHGMQLPPQYALFGKVIDGLDVLDRIQRVPTGPGDRPSEPVTIESVTITES